MRKKSHISLARYIVNSLDDKELKKHRFSFYIGSVLPDIKPSFIYKRHEINGTFPYVKKHIARLSEGQKVMNKKNRKYYRDLGQVSHYLADYFTFPHNKIYPGGFKDHCSYEERLKRDLRSYIKAERLRGSIFPADILWMRKHSAIISRKRMMIILNENMMSQMISRILLR